MTSQELNAITPFHQQAEEVGLYVQAEREREMHEHEAECECGRPGCPDCNTD